MRGCDGLRRERRHLAQTTVANDNVFGDNTAAQIAAMTPALTGSVAAGYSGSIPDPRSCLNASGV
jgi:hypothetical protein